MDNKFVWKDRDISKVIGSITWSGAVSEAARRLEFTVAHGPQDHYFPNFDIQCGDKVYFYDQERELFRGTVVTREKSSRNGELAYTAYDDVFYLLRNKTSYNFGQTTAEEIARRVLADHKFTVSNLAKTNIPISLLSNDMCLYDIIQAAYTLAHNQNGKLYGIVSREGKMIVYERGWTVANFEISEDKNITESSFSETIENMVNTVKIADSTGTQVGYVQNAEWLSQYGAMKDIVYKEDGMDAVVAANAKLKGPEQTASVTALGNTYCLFGNTVKIKESGTGLVGVFAIQSDSHEWSNGQYTMHLELMFEAFMDEKTDQKDSSSTGGESGTTVNALFTAYYPANNKMEGGFYDAMGNRLDPSKNTCAAPRSIPFGTKIKVMETGTGKDGQIYTVTDRGGAITISNGVYHFDLLMSSSAQCNNWGRVNGQALIIEESSEGSDTNAANGNYKYPFRDGYRVGTPYGKRGSLWSCKWHCGQDMTATGSKNIYAIASGTVITAGWGGSYGNYLKVKHNDGYVSLYAHMSKINVKRGQTVNTDTCLGVQGATGNVTGPHLHLEVRSPGNDRYPADTNPMTYLKARL